MTRRRVVITGMGLISPLGVSPDAVWTAFRAGRSGVTQLEGFPTDHLPTTIAAEAREFTGQVDDFGPLEKEQKKAIRKGLKLMNRDSQMGVAAAQRALADAGLNGEGRDPERSGVLIGTDYMLTMPQEFIDGIRICSKEESKFDYSRWGSEGLREMTPLWLLKYLPNMPASHIAIYNDLRGPNNSITVREASANLAIGEAMHTILRGSADVMVAGATGTRVHPVKAVHAVQTEQLAPAGDDPARAARPFDLDRKGMVLGEGAGVVVLEELEHARARGARVHAEVVGAASRTVLDRQGAARRADALASAMQATLEDATAGPEEVGHVHAHGLSTQSSDVAEAEAIHRVFGPRTADLPVTAAKSYFGNLGAGSGAVELIASTLALAADQLIPILNYDTPDPKCPVCACRTFDTNPGRSFLNVNVTPQGQAAAVMVRTFE